TGETATGAPFQQALDVALPDEIDEHPGLLRLWARHRIDARLDQLRAHPEQAAEIRREVTGLALEHALASPDTAVVAVDSEAPDTTPESAPVRVDVPQGAPEGLETEPAAAEMIMFASMPESPPESEHGSGVLAPATDRDGYAASLFEDHDTTDSSSGA